MDNVAWISRHQRNLWNSGELSMKSMGFTPKIQRCAGLFWYSLLKLDFFLFCVFVCIVTIYAY